MRAQRSAPASSHSGRTYRLRTSDISGDTHVFACTPFVIDVTGASSAGTSGQSEANISRDTLPCSFDTAFDRPASRRPITAMLKRSSGGSPGRWPSAMRSSTVSPHSFAHPAKYFSIISRGKRSIPAGTGVCVVKMLPAWVASIASA